MHLFPLCADNHVEVRRPGLNRLDPASGVSVR